MRESSFYYFIATGVLYFNIHLPQGLTTDVCHTYGSLAGVTKKGWDTLLVDIKMAANRESYSLVASGGHNNSTHLLNCCRGIVFRGKTKSFDDVQDE